MSIVYAYGLILEIEGDMFLGASIAKVVSGVSAGGGSEAIGSDKIE